MDAAVAFLLAIRIPGAVLAVLGSIFFSVSASAAGEPNPALEFLRAGKYEQAIEAGKAQNTAKGLSIAAYAAVSDIMLRIPPCLDCVHRAEDLARQAIAVDPKAPLPHVYLAVSLGYETRIIGALESQRKGLAKEMKSALDYAIAADPKNTFAITSLGVWNIEAVRIAGSTLAQLMLGANIDDGIANFTQAIAIDPDVFVIRYYYALSLASCDVDKYHDVIAEQLARAAQGKPQSVFESVVQKRANDLLSLLKAGAQKAFADQVKRYMGIPE